MVFLLCCYYHILCCRINVSRETFILDPAQEDIEIKKALNTAPRNTFSLFHVKHFIVY